MATSPPLKPAAAAPYAAIQPAAGDTATPQAQSQPVTPPNAPQNSTTEVAKPTAQQPPPQPADTSSPVVPVQQPSQEVKPVQAVPPSADNAFDENSGGSGGNGSGGAAGAPKFVEKEGPDGKIRYVERPEDSKLILELTMSDRITVLDSDLEVWQVNETALVPLGTLAKLIDFPITVDTSRGVANGWFIKPDNAFHLDYPYASAQIGGKTIPMPKGGIVETHLDDIYVSLDVLSAWFPIQFTLNYNELRLYIKPLVNLPFQDALKRKQEADALKRSLNQQPGLGYDPKDVIKLPYRMFSAPVVQVSNGITHASSPSAQTTSTTTSVNAQFDLLGLATHFTGNYATQTHGYYGLSSFNLNMSKDDYDGVLLGPLHATHFEMGDVTTGAFPLVGSQTGRGVEVNNQPYNFVSDANHFQITGFGPPGWDVEVLQNNQLLAFGQTDLTGRYLFTALPLNSGFNLFKIVLYGPSGEQETRYQRFYLGQNMVPQGKFYYNVSGLESSTPFINIGQTPAQPTVPTVSATGEYGVTNYLSAMTGYFRGPAGNTRLDGAGLGLRTSGGNTYAQANAFFDHGGGQSSSVLVTGNFSDTASFNIAHTSNIGYTQDAFSTLHDTNAQVSKVFDFANKIIPSVSLTLGADQSLLSTGQLKLAETNRLSTNFGSLALTNLLERDSFNDGTPDKYTGTLEARYRSPLGVLHGTAAYDVYRPFQVTGASFTLESPINPQITLTNGVSATFPVRTGGGSSGAHNTYSLSSALDWKMDRLRVGLAVSGDTQRNRQIGMTLAYNFVPRSLTGDYTVSSKTEDLNAGRLVIRPFIDLNGDGKWEQGEPLVQGVQFHNLLRGAASSPTGDGMDVVSGLTPNLANRISLDEKTLTDLSLSPEKKQIVVMGKSGVNGPVDYPFSKTGGVSGALFYIGADGIETPFQNVHMVLLDASGKQVADTYSETDGYFGFESLRIGVYTISFPPSEELKQHYTGKAEGPKITLPFDNPDIANLKLVAQGDTLTLKHGESNPATQYLFVKPGTPGATATPSTPAPTSAPPAPAAPASP
jgi:hypothetical protein